VAIELRPASTLTHVELAALFTAAFEGYAIPFEVDEPTFAYMVGAFDLDLEQSLVAEDDGTPVGLANLGRRGWRTWLGGIGVVGSKRREGIGELLTRSLLDRADALRATEMTLEVIAEKRARDRTLREARIRPHARARGIRSRTRRSEWCRGACAARRDARAGSRIP
jgi:hypothetical protein